MIAGAALFFSTLWGRVALGAGLVVALVGVRACDVANQRSIGENRAVTKIEKATDNAVKIGTSAAAKSRTPADVGRVLPGVRDPLTRD
jgi:hypothetical protein